MPAYENERAEQRRTAVQRSSRPAPGPLPPILALQGAAGNANVSRMIAVQRRAHDEESHQAGADPGHSRPVQRSEVEAAMSRPASPMKPEIHRKVEAAAGESFRAPLVHRDAEARELARRFSATAFTTSNATGTHVFVGEAAVADDERTMAHEDAHALHQTKGSVPGTDNGAGIGVSSPGDPGEVSADSLAHRALSISLPAQGAAQPDDEV